MANSEKSITWIIVAIMIVVALFGWGFLAGSYNGAHAGRIRQLGGMSKRELQEHLSKMSKEEIEELQDSVAYSPSGTDVIVSVRGEGMAHFVVIAFAQLPNFLAVIGWHLKNRIWLPIVIVLLELLIFFGGFKMKALEKQLAKPYRPKH